MAEYPISIKSISEGVTYDSLSSPICCEMHPCSEAEAREVAVLVWREEGRPSTGLELADGAEWSFWLWEETMYNDG